MRAAAGERPAVEPRGREGPMEYSDTLIAVVEVAIAFAGFSGIVSIFGRPSPSEWSLDDRHRLSNLLRASFTALFVAFFALLLLGAGLPERRTWAISSAVWALCWLVLASNSIFRARAAIRSGEVPAAATMYLRVMLVASVAFTLLQVANAVYLQTFWAFLSGLLFALAAAASQFVRLLYAPRQ
jgi:hypothetical protein